MDKVSKAQKIVGSNPEKGRNFADFYATPSWAVEALLVREEFKGNIWEPACGTGNISQVLIDREFEVYSTDILNYGYGTGGIDFLNTNSLFGPNHKRHANIITNPPFQIAGEFVKMAKEWSDHKIAFLLKTLFLEGVERYDMWQDKAFPFKKMYQFARRVNFGQEAGTHNNGGMLSFAWFIWEKGYKGSPTIEWIL